MVKFINQPLNRLVIVDNDGNPVVLIGPGGVIQLLGPGGHIDMLADGGHGIPTIYFYNKDSSKRAFINLGNSDPAHADLGINSGSYPSLQFPGINVNGRLWFLQPGLNTNLGFSNTQTQVQVGGQLSYGEKSVALILNDGTGVGQAQVLVNNLSPTPGVTNPGVFLQAGNGSGINGPLLSVLSTSILVQNAANTRVLQFDTDGFLKVFNAGWNNIIPGNGWSQTNNFGWRLMPDGCVQFRGSLKYGNTTDGTPIFALPAVAFPNSNTEFICSTTGGSTWNKISIDTGGIGKFFNGNGVPPGGEVMVSNIHYATV